MKRYLFVCLLIGLLFSSCTIHSKKNGNISPSGEQQNTQQVGNEDSVPIQASTNPQKTATPTEESAVATASSANDINEAKIKVQIGQKTFDLNKPIPYDDVIQLNSNDLSILRNSFYAKYNYIFKNDKYTRIFSQYKWSQRKYSNVDEFSSESDKLYINMILSLEKNEARSYRTAEGIDISNTNKLSSLFDNGDFSVENIAEYHDKFIYGQEVDLNSDGINDNIIFDCDQSDTTAHETLLINDQKYDFEFYEIMKICVVDFDIADKYKEIVILDESIDGLDWYGIYRYIGDNIIEIGTINDAHYIGSILYDNKNKIVPYVNRIDYLDPIIISGFYEIVGNKLEYMSSYNKKFENKEYVFNQDRTINFIESDQLPTEGSIPACNCESLEIKKGEKVFLNKIRGNSLISCINVILGDGRIVNIYSWYVLGS